MIKRILCGAAAAGFAVSLLASSPAHASCNEGSNYVSGDDPDTTTVEVTNKLADLPDGGVIYGEQNAAGTGGLVGITGDHGYLEAGGDATSGGYVEGESADAPVNGRLEVGNPTSVCVNDTPVG